MIHLTTEKKEQIQQLQKDILDMQGFRALSTPEKNTALGSMSAAFPNGVFPLAAVHEFVSHTQEESAATCGFMAALLSSLMNDGTFLWVSARRLIFPPALKTFGIAPDQVIFIEAPGLKDRLWTIEEGLKCHALTAVIGEVSDLTFTESRRLQLAVENSRVTGFIHRYGGRPAGSTACVSRWNIKPLGCETDGFPGVGFPRWEATMLKIRNGKPGTWNVTWTDAGLKIIHPQPEARILPITKAV